MAGTVIEELLIALGVDTRPFSEGLRDAQAAAAKTEAAFDQSAARWRSTLMGVARSVVAPLAGIATIGAAVNSYISGVSQVAQLTGAYNAKLEEWRYKRALLSRITREDIELYKKCKDATVGFNIAMQDLSAKIMRTFNPVIKAGVDLLYKVTDWVKNNEHNLVRMFQVVAGVLTAVFLPALLKVGAALLANPLTWIVAALAALAVVIDDLVVYMRGGKSAFAGFWSVFGTGEEVAEGLSGALETLKGLFETIGPAVLYVVGAIALMKTGAMVFALLTKGAMAFKTAMLALAANPLIAVFTALLALCIYLVKTWNEAGGSFTKFFDLILEDVKAIGDAIWNFFRMLWDGITGFFEGIGDKVADADWPGILSGYIAGFLNLLGTVPGLILEAFAAVPAKILDLIGLDGAAETVREWAHNTAQSFAHFGDFVTGIPGRVKAAFASLGDSIGQSVSGAFEGIKSAWDSAAAWMGEKAESAAGVISRAWDSTRESASGLWQSVKSGVSGAFEKLRTGLGTFRDVARYALDTQDVSVFFSHYFDEDIAGRVWEAQEAVRGFVTDAAAGVRTLWEDFKADPWGTVVSRLQSAKDFITGAVDGLGRKVRETFGDTAGDVYDAVTGIYREVFSLAGDGVAFIAGLYADAAGKIRDFVSDAATWVATLPERAREMAGQVAAWFEGLPGRIRSAVENAAAAIREKFTEAYDYVTGLFEKLIGWFTGLGSRIAEGLNLDGLAAKLMGGIASLVDKIPDVLRPDALGEWADSVKAAGRQAEQAPQVNASQVTQNTAAIDQSRRTQTREVNATQNNSITIVPPNGASPEAYGQAMEDVMKRNGMAYDYVSVNEGANYAI